MSSSARDGSSSSNKWRAAASPWRIAVFTSIVSVRSSWLWFMLFKTCRALSSAFVIAGFAAGFLFELNVANDDGFVEGLSHVVDGEGGNGGSGEGFHFNASRAGSGGGGMDTNAAGDDLGFDVYMCERQRV